jgi:hypothetical protein
VTGASMRLTSSVAWSVPLLSSIAAVVVVSFILATTTRVNRVIEGGEREDEMDGKERKQLTNAGGDGPSFTLDSLQQNEGSGAP